MLKILVINDVFPHLNNRTTIFFRNIIPIISKKFDVKVYWLITDNYGEKPKETNPHYEILYMSDFKNALQVIQKVKPNIMYYSIGWHITQYALMLAVNFLKIPSFVYLESAEIQYYDNNDSTLKQMSEYIRQFFTMKNVGENKNIKKSRGINFLKKIIFLIKTIRSIGKSRISTVKEIFYFLYSLNGRSGIGRYSRFNCDLMFAEILVSMDTLDKWGLKKESTFIIGNPAYDRAFKEREHISNKVREKVNILFLTANLSGGQGKSNWTTKKQEQMIKELITNLKKCKSRNITYN